MLLKVVFLASALLLPPPASPSPVPKQAYGALSVQTPELTEGNEFVDIVLELLPNITSIFRSGSNGVSEGDLKQAQRFQEIVEVFLPVMRKALEFRAEDEGRPVDPKDVEMLDTLENGLFLIATLIDSGVDLAPAETMGNELPDYTDLLPDITIPEVHLPEVKIPQVKIPEIAIPGQESIPARDIPIPAIPEVKIPARKVPVTTRPAAHRVVTSKSTKTEASPSSASPSSSSPSLSPKVVAPFVFGPSPLPPLPGSAIFVRQGTPSTSLVSSPTSFFTLPGGGYVYSTRTGA